MASAWRWEHPDSRCIIVVNLSGSPSKGRIRIPWQGFEGRSWRLTDIFNAAVYERSGDELRGPGLYVDLPAWGFYFLLFF